MELVVLSALAINIYPQVFDMRNAVYECVRITANKIEIIIEYYNLFF